MNSIVIPTLNEAAYLPRLLDSIAEQSYREFEVVVVDGGSTDATVALALARNDDFPLRVLTTGHADISSQRNAGARAAHGDWLVLVDADEILMPYALERCARFAEDEGVSFFTTWCRADTDRRRDAILALLANLMYEGSLKTKRPFCPGPFTAIRREEFELVGGYTEEQAYQEDFDLSVRLAKAGVGLRVLPETLYAWSTRRVQKQGTLRMVFEWASVGLYVLVFRRPLKHLPGYVMGGQHYDTAETEPTSGGASGATSTGLPDV